MQPIYVCYLGRCVETGSGIIVTPEEIKIAALLAIAGFLLLLLKAAHHCITYVAQDE